MCRPFPTEGSGYTPSNISFPIDIYSDSGGGDVGDDSVVR